MLGFSNVDVSAWAMAVVKYPSLAPFATDETKWTTLATGGDGTNYYFGSGGVTSGSDGIPEIEIFPGTWGGSDLPPGNFATLNIGPDSGNASLRDQIDKGPDAGNFAFHGGALSTGMQIPGKTGANANIQTAFVGGNADGREYAGIIGKTRFMPTYSTATGNGANAVFTLFRIVYVKLRGVNFEIVVQPVEQTEDLSNFYLAR